MTLFSDTETASSIRIRYATGLAVWLAGGVGLVLLDGLMDVPALGMLLVLTSAVAAVWLPLPATLLLGLLSVAAFNWSFVPPRGTFAIDLHEHAILLLVMFTLNAIVAGLMSALRMQATQARHEARIADGLRAWVERLRDADDVQARLPELREKLAALTGMPVSLLVLRAGLLPGNDMTGAELLGPADAEQLAGLWSCLRERNAFGPGSGRYQDLRDHYLPLRGRELAYGAALLTGPIPDSRIAQARDLCDQTGVALERQQLQLQQKTMQQTAHSQQLRATLLAALAHDYRTPVATIMGAASSLEQQDFKLSGEQRRQLTRRIVDEADRLRRMTSNILQLGRLDTPDVQLRCDWESAEELIGALVQRYAGRALAEHLSVHVEPGLPLLWCDALLLSQLLENLIDNALKYGGDAAPVQVEARRDGAWILLSVRDNGPGIPERLRDLIFEPFRQGGILPALAASGERQGVGIGLALCRVIAAAHAGELRLDTSTQGSCFTCALPLRPQPAGPEEARSDTHRSVP